ncbi:MAG: Grx4 family monothiol glutaredoxin, partial [Nannocystaceae bacterium]
MQEPTIQDTQKQIADKVASAPVVLFMKGTRHRPQCGFSSTVVGILDSLLADYETVNVLADPAIRQGIKDYSNWPTIPQLYVNGEFLGGCDIIREMHQGGELEGALGLTGKPIEPPPFTVTPKAVEVFRQALAEDGEDAGIRSEADHVGPSLQT